MSDSKSDSDLLEDNIYGPFEKIKFGKKIKEQFANVSGIPQQITK